MAGRKVRDTSLYHHWYQVKLTFIYAPMMGTAPENPQLYREFVAGRALEAGKNGSAEEVYMAGIAARYGTTSTRLAEAEAGVSINRQVFRYDENKKRYLLPSYMILGYLKSAWEDCRDRRDIESLSASLWGGKGKIEKYIYVESMEGTADIPIRLAGPPEFQEHFVRKQNRYGEEQVFPAVSMEIPLGSSIEFRMHVKNSEMIPQAMLEEWLGYAREGIGMGGWRGSGRGRFVYELTPVDPPQRNGKV